MPETMPQIGEQRMIPISEAMQRFLQDEPPRSDSVWLWIDCAGSGDENRMVMLLARNAFEACRQRSVERWRWLAADPTLVERATNEGRTPESAVVEFDLRSFMAALHGEISFEDEDEDEGDNEQVRGYFACIAFGMCDAALDRQPELNWPEVGLCHLTIQETDRFMGLSVGFIPVEVIDGQRQYRLHTLH